MRRWIAVDGEGFGRSPHLYTYLAAGDERGKQWSISDWDVGLRTIACLDFLLSLPQSATLVGYSFHYDLTKILADLDDASLYKLFRPETRADRKGKSRHLYWRGYRLNIMGQKFSCQKGNRKFVLWDIWRFFQASFVKALKAWSIPVDTTSIEAMKLQRNTFTAANRAAIEAYCHTECRALAQLARKLVEAHSAAGIELKAFHGAGSTASALLKQNGIGVLRDKGPERMQEAIASSFFGGRFEVSRSGAVKGPVYSWDISSAYPYQLTFLPCLIHGEWRHSKREPKPGQHALIRYRLRGGRRKDAWGPFPFRTADGTITFPTQSGGGWIWQDEYFAGKKLFGKRVEFIEAWVLKRNCTCQPFRFIPEVYRQRVALGKDSAGIVLKLGPNSAYGKLAQSVGKAPPFQCWIWAAMVTSGCRAQMLDMMTLHKSLDNLLMIATDGLSTLEQITPPKPRDTGTSDLAKPLGGWEGKTHDAGMFLARPGVYWPINATDDDADAMRARGIGRAVIREQWRLIEEQYSEGELSVTLPDIERFQGVFTSVRKVNDEYKRSAGYGEWLTRPQKLSLSPAPKRNEDWSVPKYDLNTMSTPYSPALISAESEELLLAQLEATEQPD